MTKWRDILGTVAPGLATALGGPLAGLATRVISKKLLGPDVAVPDQSILEEVLEGIDPEGMRALKEAELEFQREMKSLEIDLAAIDASDRDSARKREATVKDITPRILAGVFTVGFFAMVYVGIKYPIQENAQDLMLVLYGALAAGLQQILAYYFGSSAGSKAKTDLLGKRP